jgi:hypothetical protein
VTHCRGPPCSRLEQGPGGRCHPPDVLSGRLGHDLVGEDADILDLDLNPVTGLKGGYSVAAANPYSGVRVRCSEGQHHAPATATACQLGHTAATTAANGEWPALVPALVVGRGVGCLLVIGRSRV